MSIKSVEINQTSDNDNYIRLNKNLRAGANAPAVTTDTLYANNSGLYWEDTRVNIKIYNANGVQLNI